MESTQLTLDERLIVQRVGRMLQLLREVDPRMNMAGATALVRIGQEPGITQAELASELSLHPATLNRYIAGFGCHMDFNGRPGKGLVAFDHSTEDARLKPMHLTAFGRFLVERLEEACG